MALEGFPVIAGRLFFFFVSISSIISSFAGFNKMRLVVCATDTKTNTNTNFAQMALAVKRLSSSEKEISMHLPEYLQTIDFNNNDTKFNKRNFYLKFSFK